MQKCRFPPITPKWALGVVLKCRGHLPLPLRILPTSVLRIRSMMEGEARNADVVAPAAEPHGHSPWHPKGAAESAEASAQNPPAPAPCAHRRGCRP